MSRRTKPNVRQASRIPQFFSKQAAGVSFAYLSRAWFFAAVSCGLVGGCVVTSAEEFPDETQVPPIVLDTPDLPLGSIIAFDQRRDNELRLPITVRDENIDDELQVQVQLSVVGQSMVERICPEAPIPKSGQADRAQFQISIGSARIKPRACSKVEVFVSRRFAGTCTDDEGFALPSFSRSDLARGRFWIWEMSGDPASEAEAAKGIVTSCQTVTRAPTTSMTPVE